MKNAARSFWWALFWLDLSILIPFVAEASVSMIKSGVVESTERALHMWVLAALMGYVFAQATKERDS